MAGHRLYGLPDEYRDGQWCVYDGTTNTVYLEPDDLMDALDLDLTEEALDALVEKLPLARAASRMVSPRRPNPYNNAGFVVHLAYDPVARHGAIYVESLITSDADMEDRMTNVTWQQLVRAGMALARDAQAQADWGD